MKYQKCFYCGKYKLIEKMNKVIVGRDENSSSKVKGGIDYVFSCKKCLGNKEVLKTGHN